ncbi:MAG: hypothetical protein KUG75_08150 [Pseudomonadales bacterium]|nr:hypothetical protein [Pseudomonadales bacterium]
MYKVIIPILIMLVLSACEPADRTPGMWLSGDIETTEVNDWSFSNDHQEIFLETHPWYGIPFSVTVVTATTGEKLFVPSIYSEAAEFPGSKYWNGIIEKNPQVVAKIGNKLYPLSAQLITDDAEFEEAFEALAGKYDYWRSIKDGTAERPPFVLIRLDAR